MEYLELITGDKVIVKGRHDKVNYHWMGGDYKGSMGKSVGKEFLVVSKSLSVARGSDGIEGVPCYILSDGFGCYFAISDLTILPNKRNINNPYFWARRLNKLPANMA
jgi:hypothetical protein